MLFQASSLGGSADDESKAQKQGQVELLKTVMGLAETAAA